MLEVTEKHTHRQSKNHTESIEAAGANSVGSILILLDLLEGDADLVCKGLLAHVSGGSKSLNILPDSLIDFMQFLFVSQIQRKTL